MNRVTLTATLVASATVVLIGVGLYCGQRSANQVDWTFARRGNLGLSAACEYSDAFTNDLRCQTSETPGIMVWGDSYAMHLVEGIRTTSTTGLVQATRSTCGPLVGVSSFQADGWYSRTWGEKCVKFNDDVLAYLAAKPSVEVVVMSSLYAQYLAGNRLLAREGANAAGVAGSLVEMQGSEDVAAESLRQTIASVRALGKRVVLVAPPPSGSGVDLGRCLELKAEGKVVIGADNPSCAMSEAGYRSGRASVRALLDRVAREADVPVFHLDAFLCHDGTCSVELDGVALYRDTGHLSYDGSALLGQRLDLANQLVALAR